MVSREQKIRLGVFLTVSTALMIILFVLIVGKQLMEKSDTYFIKYENTSVNGLQIGGAVKLNGISIGRVEDITIDKEDITRVIVELSIRGGTPIKSDFVATLVPVGITGLKQVELIGGSNSSKFLTSGDTIKAGVSTFDSITGKAEIIAEKLEHVLNNIAELTSGENKENFERIIENTSEIIDENKESFSSIVRNTDSLSYHVTVLAASAASSMQKIDDIIASEELQKILSNSAQFTDSIIEENLIQELMLTISEFRMAVKNINKLVQSSKRDLLPTFESLRETIDYLNEFSRQIGEEPSLLLRTKKK